MKYNMAFEMNTNAEEAAFVAGLELEGVEVRCVRGRWMAYGLSEENRRYIERHARRFWAI